MNLFVSGLDGPQRPHSVLGCLILGFQLRLLVQGLTLHVTLQCHLVVCLSVRGWTLPPPPEM